MSKERKAPETAETIVTSEGTYYQLPLFAGAFTMAVLTDPKDPHTDWEDVYQSWLARLMECGYPAWSNSTAFYLGDLNDLLHWTGAHHK